MALWVGLTNSCEKEKQKAKEKRKDIPVWMTSLVAQTVKHLSTMWETWVQSLGREVPWRKKWQPTPVLLPRKSHGQRSLVSMGSQRVRHDWATSLHFTCLNAEPSREGDKKNVINSKALTVSCRSFSQSLVVLSKLKRNLNQGIALICYIRRIQQRQQLFQNRQSICPPPKPEDKEWIGKSPGN